MDFYDVVSTRRSVRAYQDRDIPEEVLSRILEAGRSAPSGCNLQNWMFVVVRDSARRAALAEASEQKWMRQAPVIVAVVGTSGRTMFCGVKADTVDCAIAIDHMTLAATAEGLGTCWIGHFDQKQCKQLLSVPQDAKIIEMFTLGYPRDLPSKRQPRKPLDEIVRWEHYS
ncbi:MAG: nitroreductase [Phycisphaerales bacterium]|mgnify:CR=1 FL=1|jgi:nitroreductase|nr:nitroreductase [Phycisphaerales bacterium]MBT7171188.1 nitroreductase [Phycisphaerales bacterium]